MRIVKRAKQLIKKAFSSSTTISLRDTRADHPYLFPILGNDYRSGTESREFLTHAYGLNPYVFEVIDRICQRLVQITKRFVDEDGQEIESPELLALLLKPNAKEGGSAYLYRAAATYLATGECFIIRKQALNEPDQYVVPVNYNVIINQELDGTVISYRVTLFGESDTYLPGEVLHIKKPDITLDTNHGFSTLHALRVVWESNNEVWRSEASLHKNKGIQGVLYTDGNRPMTDTEREQLQQYYDSLYTGSSAFGKVKISTEKLGYLGMGMNPTDLKSIETRIEHLRTVCAAYNVDSKLFGDPAASTYNNMAEAQRAFIINAVIPLGKVLLPQIAQFMARSVFITEPFAASYVWQLVEDDIHELQLTKEQKSARLQNEVKAGIITGAQALAMLYPELVNDDRD